MVLAWRVNRYTHHYEAASVRKSVEMSAKEPTELEKELATATGCQKNYVCGVLVARHYAAIIGTQEILQGTRLNRFPGTGHILEALSLDCIMHAALHLPNNVEATLDLLADAVSANNLAVQGAIQLDNYWNRKAERAINGKAGAKKRHEKSAQLRAWTIEKYKAGVWKSANHAASELVSEVLAQSKQIVANLTKSNAQRTVAEWIRKSA